MIHCYSEFRAYALIRQYLIKKIPITKFIYKRERKAIVIFLARLYINLVIGIFFIKYCLMSA